MTARREVRTPPPVRLLLGLVLGMLFAPATPAFAAGCHEPVRPILGIALPGDAAPLLEPGRPGDAPTPGVAHSPCPADPAGPTARPVLPPAPTPGPLERAWILARAASAWPHASGDARPARTAASRWERPPRAGSIAA